MCGTLKYSVLRYSPSPISGEQINLGILICDESTDYREFYSTEKYSRLIAFDDELDIDLIHMLLCGIREVVTDMAKKFDMEEFIRFYINAFHFDDIKSITYDEMDKTLEYLRITYLH